MGKSNQTKRKPSKKREKPNVLIAGIGDLRWELTKLQLENSKLKDYIVDQLVWGQRD